MGVPCKKGGGCCPCVCCSLAHSKQHEQHSNPPVRHPKRALFRRFEQQRQSTYGSVDETAHTDGAEATTTSSTTTSSTTAKRQECTPPLGAGVVAHQPRAVYGRQCQDDAGDDSHTHRPSTIGSQRDSAFPRQALQQDAEDQSSVKVVVAVPSVSLPPPPSPCPILVHENNIDSSEDSSEDLEETGLDLSDNTHSNEITHHEPHQTGTTVAVDVGGVKEAEEEAEEAAHDDAHRLSVGPIHHEPLPPRTTFEDHTVSLDEEPWAVCVEGGELGVQHENS
jgi:hypothetical protein